jgi:hypothetical protein
MDCCDSFTFFRKTNLQLYCFSFAGNAVGGASAFKVDFLYRRELRVFGGESTRSFGLIKRIFLLLFSLNCS